MSERHGKLAENGKTKRGNVRTRSIPKGKNVEGPRRIEKSLSLLKISRKKGKKTSNYS